MLDKSLVLQNKQKIGVGLPYILKEKNKITSLNLAFPIVYGHIMLKTPVLVWSLKLSNIEPC